VIDLGPEGGDRGGEVIACGTPETVAEVEASYTGYYLKNVLIQHPPVIPEPPPVETQGRRSKLRN
jgi:excinuclease ABC subunit A